MHTIFFQQSRWVRALLSLVVVALGLLVSVPASAAGRVVWKSTTVKEHSTKEAWYLECEIHLPAPPDIAHKSMKFEFTQISEYERSLVDGKEEPQQTTIPLANQQALIESQTVGFMDPGTGTTQSRTRFSFKVTRAHGYRAGQWKVKIRDSDTGAVIGTETTLTFNGENPVVDRRSIVFTGTKKKEKKEEPAPSEDSASSESPSSEDSAAASEEAPTGDEAQAAEAPAAEEGQVPPSIEEKPGGGCQQAPFQQHNGWPAALLLGLVLVFARRRFA